MEDPLNPPENQGPLDNQDPLDDPLLDAPERSIENPPGFVDPLAERDELFMDDLAKQLEEVEASIEDRPPMVPKPEIVKDSNKTEEEDEQAPPPADSYEPPKMREEVWGTFQSSPPLPQEGSAHTPPPNPPLPKLPRGGGSIRPRPSLLLKGRLLGRAGRTIIGISSNLRFCPESHETINIQECEKCEKYRHWPEGTDEEPRECWYDWQATQSSDDSNENR